MYQSRRLDPVTSIFQRRTNFVNESLMTTVLILYLTNLYYSNNLDAWSFVYPKTNRRVIKLGNKEATVVSSCGAVTK